MTTRRFPCLLLILLSVLGTSQTACAQAVSLTAAQLNRVGQRIWQNECAGSVTGLTSWNSGEDFASLGIGHFIWYPAGRRGPFEESFPPLASFSRISGGADAEVEQRPLPLD
jgi:hypothetical protein